MSLLIWWRLGLDVFAAGGCFGVPDLCCLVSLWVLGLWFRVLIWCFWYFVSVGWCVIGYGFCDLVY